MTNLNDAGAGSVRQAIIDTPSGGTVDFQPGLSGAITLTSGELMIAKDLTIAGPGTGVITVSGNHASRVFNVAATFTVDISGLTIADGLRFGGPGGGIFNSGTLTITDSTLSGNTASRFAGAGGGIYNTGTLTVASSTLSGNSANGGGGIYNTGTLTVTSSTLSGNSAGPRMSSGGGIFNSGTLTVTASTLSGNSAYSCGGIANTSTLTVTASTLSGNSAAGSLGRGGGICNGGTLTVTASTLSGNSASGGLTTGGGIYNDGGTLILTSCTLSGNSAGSTGGGIFRNTGTVSTKNTILASNTASSSPDLSGLLNSQGHNLIGDGTGGSGFADTDLVGTPDQPIDPQLEPLGDYGGPTQTMRPLPSSPAVDAGDNTDAPDTDQRGFDRIVGILDPNNPVIDIGSVELQLDELGGLAPRIGRLARVALATWELAGDSVASVASVASFQASPFRAAASMVPARDNSASAPFLTRGSVDTLFASSHRPGPTQLGDEYEVGVLTLSRL